MVETAKAPRRQDQREEELEGKGLEGKGLEGKGLEGKEPGEVLDGLAHAVIGAAIDVHRELGPGYPESVYEEALGIELELRKVPFARQQTFAVTYKGRTVGEGRIDLLVADSLVVELKAVDNLLPIHRAQAISYLKALDLRLALLINFKVPVLRDGVQRVVRSR